MTTAARAESTFSLDAIATASQDLTLTLSSPATVPIKVIHGGDPTTVALDLTPFSDERGITVPVTFSVGTVDRATHAEGLALSEPLLPVNLNVGLLPAAGRFVGRLILTAPRQATVVWRIVLTSSAGMRPAVLVLDTSTLTISAVRKVCLWKLCFGADPSVNVHLREKTGTLALDGVTARLDPGLKIPMSDSDLARHMTASFDDDDAGDLFASPPHGKRDVAEGKQATVRLTFHHLEPGEYTIPLRFAAANSTDEDSQRLTVTIQMRNAVGGAVAVLMFAAAFSFVFTRIVGMLRKRAAFLTRVKSLGPAWLGNEAPNAPVIWLRATLHQAQALSKRLWLSGDGEIEERLLAAARMLDVLDAVRRVRSRLETRILEQRVRLRATWKLDNIVKDIGARQLSDADVAAFKTQLTDLEAWADPTRTEELYWADAKAAIAALCSEVNPAEIDGDDGAALAQQLLAELAPSILNAPPDLTAKQVAESVYERLRVLWELRGRRRCVQQLVALHVAIPRAPIQRVYDVIDKEWWSTLTNAGTTVQVEVPQSRTYDPPDAYDLIVFRVGTPDEPSLPLSYLMRWKLVYDWTLTITSGAKPIGALRVQSTKPDIAQYSPSQGEIRATVRIGYPGHPGERIVEAAPVKVQRSRDFSARRAFDAADWIAFALALFASVVSGVMVYALSPTFGSLKDYLSLFVWGAGIDQGKNFLQSLSEAGTRDH